MAGNRHYIGKLIICALSVCLLFGITRLFAEAPPKDYHFQAAVKQYLEGDNEAALVSLKKSLEVNPDNQETLEFINLISGKKKIETPVFRPETSTQPVSTKEQTTKEQTTKEQTTKEQTTKEQTKETTAHINQRQNAPENTPEPVVIKTEGYLPAPEGQKPDYHTELICKIDAVLLIISLLFLITIILYMMIQACFEKRHKRRLWDIKKNVYNIIASGDNTASRAYSPIIAAITPNEFLDIEMNRIREAAFFNAAEQNLLKDCFLDQGVIEKLGKTALKGFNKWRRIEAILLLGYAGITEALNVFKRTALDKDKDISYFSVSALGRTKTLESAKLLVDIFVIKKHLRRNIASFFDGFPAEAADIFIKLIEQKESSLRIWGLNLVGRFGSRGHGDVIKALTMDSIDEVRAAACECLGKIGDQNSVSYIEKRLTDKSWLVRAQAVRALSELLGEASLPNVMPLINDSSITVIASVKKALTSNIKNALPYLANIFKGNDNLAKRVAIEALEISGHLKIILKGVLGGPDKKTGQYEDILKGILVSRVYAGLASAIAVFEENVREVLLSKLRHLDSIAAAEIEKMMISRRENALRVQA